MKRKGKTSQRTILFRQNVNRDNEEWAHFLEGYREWLMDWDMTTYGDDWHTAEDQALAQEDWAEAVLIRFISPTKRVCPLSVLQIGELVEIVEADQRRLPDAVDGPHGTDLMREVDRYVRNCSQCGGRKAKASCELSPCQCPGSKKSAVTARSVLTPLRNARYGSVSSP